MLTNEWELRLLFVFQDSRDDPFGWWSLVMLLSLWEHTGMENVEHGNVIYADMIKLKNISKLAKM